MAGVEGLVGGLVVDTAGLVVGGGWVTNQGNVLEVHLLKA